MAQNVYDPYGSEQGLSLGQTVKDFATSPIRLSTYAGFYTSWPGMWSPSKGVFVPYIGKRLEEGGWKAVGTGIKSLATRNYTERGFAGVVRGTFSLGKDILSRAASFGMSSNAGGGFWGEKLFSEGGVRVPKGIDFDYSSTHAAYVRKLLLKKEKQTANLAAEWGVKRAKGASKISQTILEAYNKGDYMLSGKSIFEQASRLTERSQRFATKAVSASGKYTIKAMPTRVGLLKFGAGVMKGASFVGGAMMAWDFVSMVGIPLGRAAIRGLDNVMGEYQRRFMPEMGGRLEMSYLSKGAATERQRSINAISKSYINGRSAFGEEARYLHA